MTGTTDRPPDPALPDPADDPAPAAEPAPAAAPAQEAAPADESIATRRLDRRSFVVRAIAATGGLTAALVGIPVAGFAAMPFFRAKTPIRLLSDAVPPTMRSEEWATAGAVDDFKVGEPRMIPLQRSVVDGWNTAVEPVAVYVVRQTETDFETFDIHCTHLGCPLAFASGSATFVCPCHGGSFSITGQVLSGPPPRPMVQFETRVQDGEVQVGPMIEEV